MNYLKEMNQLDTGFEVIYYDESLTYYTNSFDTEDKAVLFITSTLDMVGIISA